MQCPGREAATGHRHQVACAEQFLPERGQRAERHTRGPDAAARQAEAGGVLPLPPSPAHDVGTDVGDGVRLAPTGGPGVRIGGQRRVVRFDGAWGNGLDHMLGTLTQLRGRMGHAPAHQHRRPGHRDDRRGGQRRVLHHGERGETVCEHGFRGDGAAREQQRRVLDQVGHHGDDGGGHPEADDGSGGRGAPHPARGGRAQVQAGPVTGGEREAPGGGGRDGVRVVWSAGGGKLHGDECAAGVPPAAHHGEHDGSQCQSGRDRARRDVSADGTRHRHTCHPPRLVCSSVDHAGHALVTRSGGDDLTVGAAADTADRAEPRPGGVARPWSPEPHLLV